MNTEWLTYLRELGSVIYLTAASASPWTLLWVGLALPFLAFFILHLYRNVARNVEAVWRTLLYHLSELIASRKTWFMVKIRHLLPRRKKTEDAFGEPQVEFDDLDIAVLKIAATLGPGLAINAPELADRFRIRPAVVERSLEKLRGNKMLDHVIGSEEGFDNYRLTQLGNAFMSTWARQTSRA